MQRKSGRRVEGGEDAFQIEQVLVFVFLFRHRDINPPISMLICLRLRIFLCLLPIQLPNLPLIPVLKKFFDFCQPENAWCSPVFSSKPWAPVSLRLPFSALLPALCKGFWCKEWNLSKAVCSWGCIQTLRQSHLGRVLAENEVAADEGGNEAAGVLESTAWEEWPREVPWRKKNCCSVLFKKNLFLSYKYDFLWPSHSWLNI